MHMSKTEIPYLSQPPAQPCAAVRVLMAEGRWLVPPGERPLDWQEREKDIAMPPPAPPVEPPARVARPILRRPGRPRVRAEKAHPHAGEGKAWNARVDVTDAMILELRECGLSYTEIGARLGINRTTAFKRLKLLGVAAIRIPA